MIEEIINEINSLLRNGYPYSALGMALALPDICGNIAYHGLKNGERYRKWFDEYVLSNGYKPSDDGFIDINGAICYKLRCAYLHSGNFDLGNADEVKDIKIFKLHYSRDSLIRFIHINETVDKKYQIDIDLGVLCGQICEAAKRFYSKHQSKYSDVLVEISDETLSEQSQENFKKKLKDKTGYSIEKIIEIKKKDPTFMIDI